MLNMKIIYNWFIFHSYVKFPEGMYIKSVRIYPSYTHHISIIYGIISAVIYVPTKDKYNIHIYIYMYIYTHDIMHIMLCVYDIWLVYIPLMGNNIITYPSDRYMMGMYDMYIYIYDGYVWYVYIYMIYIYIYISYIYMVYIYMIYIYIYIPVLHMVKLVYMNMFHGFG